MNDYVGHAASLQIREDYHETSDSESSGDEENTTAVVGSKQQLLSAADRSLSFNETDCVICNPGDTICDVRDPSTFSSLFV